MLIFTDIKQLDAARKRLMKAKPRIDLLCFGEYSVIGSKGDEYKVICKTDASNKRIVFCTCEDKYPRKLNDVCYHIAGALSLHLYLCEGRVLTFGKDRPEMIWLTNL